MGWIENNLFAGSSIFAWALLLSLVISALGFLRVVYFVSLGYAFSVVGIAVLAGAWFRETLSMTALLHCALLGLYGLRLGGYLMPRERNPSYQEKQDYKSEQSVSMAGRVSIWVSVSLLYVAMCSPGLYHLIAVQQKKPMSDGMIWTGLSIMMFGLGLESFADWQKSAYKKKHPKHYCDEGLYRWVRCPNYLGEMIFWTGNLVVGWSAMHTPGPWIIGILGLLSIYYIMLYSTSRLERKQLERYGDSEEFQEYVQSVPILIPFIPLYSMKKMPFLLRY